MSSASFGCSSAPSTEVQLGADIGDRVRNPKEKRILKVLDGTAIPAVRWLDNTYVVEVIANMSNI